MRVSVGYATPCGYRAVSNGQADQRGEPGAAQASLHASQLDSYRGPLDTGAAVTQPVITEHIEVTPDVCGGRPRVVGGRIRVQDVVAWHEALGLSPDEIVSQHPEIALADVYAALAYYHDHREEIRGHMQEDAVLATSMRAQAPSRLVQKLTGRNGGDSIPSG